MAGYVKLFGSILDSTVWNTPPAITKVWIAMLAMADADGIVAASVPGLARRACVERQDAEAALALFLAPDEDSRTKDFQGRRIEVVDGGWHLLNHGKYRALHTPEERRRYEADRKRKYRENHRVDEMSHDVPDSPTKSRKAEADPSADTEAGRWSPLDWRRHFGRFWAEAKGRLAYGVGSGSDGKATGDLRDILSSLPDQEKLKAERLAPDMFRLYLAETGKAAQAQHPWSWFVTRFNSLLTDAMKTGKQNSTGFVPSDLPED